MSKVYKFPSIGALRNTIDEVIHRATFKGLADNGDAIYDEDAPLPTLSFRGSVKLHGTNAGIVFVWNPLTFTYDVQFQSKEQILTPLKDNAGFATFGSTINTDAILAQIMKVKNDLGYTPEVVRVYGEWCGGNIQKNAGVNGLPKMFVIVGIKIDDLWLTGDELAQIKNPNELIFNILDYPTYTMDVDFANPKEAADKMALLVDEVEGECPVAKAFGNEGGIGEGIVWVGVTEGWTESRFWFKTKGEKHAGSGKKVKVPIDIERVESINALVEVIVADGRLLQGFDFLKENRHELTRKSTGIYVNWVFADVIKEDLDVITGNGFEPKDVKSAVCDKARKFFFVKLDEGYGL